MENKDITNTELLTAIRENGQAIEKNTQAIQQTGKAVHKNTILIKGLIEQVAENAEAIASMESSIAQLPALLSVRNSVDFEQQDKRISVLEGAVLNT